MYKKIIDESGIIDIAKDVFIPNDPERTDYVQYLQWLSQGNTPEPADTLDPKIAISAEITQLETASMLPRVTREFMLLFMQSQATPEALATLPAYVKVKALDDTIATLRTQL